MALVVVLLIASARVACSGWCGVGYYDILGISPEASSSDISRAAKMLLRKHHPNGRDPNLNYFAMIKEAESVLKNETLREQYDQMGRMCDMDEIVPGVFLGSAQAAEQSITLKKLGISHVMTVANDVNECRDEDISHIRIPIKDDPSQNILTHIPTALSFISNATTSGAKILIHCKAGVSRSVTIVIAFLMAAYGISLADAYCVVQYSRSAQIHPNNGFLSQLQLWERAELNSEIASQWWLQSVQNNLRDGETASMTTTPFENDHRTHFRRWCDEADIRRIREELWQENTSQTTLLKLPRVLL
eukprot:c3953_g1_i4.p1 GENE.c3953_g1_i4~~c3953_g1_i4.p1  ORF type:complete len:303 (+),score=52.90 c3953_g1_i4:34-942(+)